jgi:hypothetical protein
MIVDLTGVTWRKSRRSNQTACVEFAVSPGVAAVRDSKRPEAGHVVTTRPEWTSFLTAVKVGTFDL